MGGGLFPRFEACERASTLVYSELQLKTNIPTKSFGSKFAPADSTGDMPCVQLAQFGGALDVLWAALIGSRCSLFARSLMACSGPAASCRDSFWGELQAFISMLLRFEA